MDFWTWVEKMVWAKYPGNITWQWNDFKGIRTPIGVIDWKNARDKDGLTLLHVAAGNGLEEYVKEAINYGVNVNRKAKDESTPLHHLLQCSNNLDKFHAILKLLLENGASLNARNRMGNNVLFQAVFEGKSKELLEVLINSGSKWKNVTNGNGLSVLHVAAMGGTEKNLAALRYFVSKGADVNIKDFNERTPLHLAAVHAKRDVFYEIISFLLEKGADVNAVDDDGNNALLAAAVAPVNLVEDDEDESSALPTTAAPKRTKRELEFLVTIGCNPNLINKARRSILHLVTEGGDMNVVNYCLKELKADVNGRDIEGRTPLHYCAAMPPDQPFMGNVTLLIEAGADIKAEDIDGKTLLDLAKQEGRKENQLNELVKVGAQLGSGQKGRRRIH